MAWLIGCVIVAAIFIFSRRAGVAVIVLLAAVWIGLWLITDRKSERQPTVRSVAITASSDRQLCPEAEKPVAVSLTNNADVSLESVSFGLFAREPGASAVIYRATHTVAKTMAPGEVSSACYGLNYLSFADRTIQYDARALTWSAEVTLTRFAGR
jgi:hypothetical protein